MEHNDHNSDRRAFIGTLATGAAALSLAGLAPLQSMAKKHHDPIGNDDPDAWFNKLKGKHKIMFDVTRPNETMPFAWPRIFLMTNQMTGTPENQNNAVVVLRHEGIPYAMQDDLWAKYKFGELFKVNDPMTKQPAVRNPFWQPKPGDFKVPGVGNVAIGINELQASGVMFCVCNMAMTVYSAVVGQMTNQKPEDVLKEFTSGVLPGVQIVPSGVWAVGRAQEHGCAYCYAG